MPEISQRTRSAVLLISCPDRKGLVAVISDFVFRHDGNILHADEHRDAETGLFLMRVEFDPSGMDVGLDELATQFAKLAERYEMRWRLAKGQRRPRMGILVSQYDHCLADLLYRHKAGELDCDIPLVLSNHTDAARLAGFYGAEFVHIPVTRETKQAVEQRQIAMLREQECDLVVLARYMQILSPAISWRRYPAARSSTFIIRFCRRSSARGRIRQAFERGVKLIGATSHYVTEVLDDGPIIEQDVVRISHRDTVEELVQKGRDLEKVVLSRAVGWHIENRVLLYGKKTVVFD